MIVEIVDRVLVRVRKKLEHNIGDIYTEFCGKRKSDTSAYQKDFVNTRRRLIDSN